MDRVFQKTNDYAVGISMYSNRIGNYEFGNTENKHGWHTADGMFYLYNGDTAQFDEGYWTTIDPYRLPGTTVDTKSLEDGAHHSVKSPQQWVGGSNNGKFASIGMYLDKTNEGMDLNAKKSWFLLDDQIINLGADINGRTDDSIETIIENRLLSEAHTISINGDNFVDEAKDVVGWVNMTSKNQTDNIGYIIPDTNNNVNMYKEERTGKYTDINEYFVSDKEYVHDYMTIHQNYGKVAENESYEYVIVPGKTDEEIAAIADQPKYEVLANEKDVQAIETEELLLANFWEEAQLEGKVKAHNPVSVIVEEQDGNKLAITLSNPKQNNEIVSITLFDEIDSIISVDDRITIDEQTIQLDSANLQGTSQTVVVQLEKEELDKERLEELVASASDLKADNYTKESWDVLQASLLRAEEVLADDQVSQKRIDEAVEELDLAIQALIEVEDEIPEPKPVDKSALEKAVEKAADLKKADYTEES